MEDFLEVHAGAERIAGAGDDEHAHRVVVAQFLQRAVMSSCSCGFMAFFLSGRLKVTSRPRWISRSAASDSSCSLSSLISDARSRPAQSGSRSLNFSTLPFGSFGSASMKLISRGRLKEAIVLAAMLDHDLRADVLAGPPHHEGHHLLAPASSGPPTTAASSTAGWLISAFSTSRE